MTEYRYTKAQAARAKHRVDSQLARIEAEVNSVRAAVSSEGIDTISFDKLLHDVTAVAYELKAVIDERTSPFTRDPSYYSHPA